VRHVDDAHQSEADGETAGEQEQQRGEGHAVDRLEDAALHEKKPDRNGGRASGCILRPTAPARAPPGSSGRTYRL
jgi:hypothetical protein